LNEKVEIEGVSESPRTPTKPLSSHLPYIVSYVGTLTHRLDSPIHSPSFFLIAKVSSTSVVVDTDGVHTPSLPIGGGTISIYSIAPNMVVVGSTSILGLSGGIQPSTPFTGAYPFGMPSSDIPSVSSNSPSTSSVSMTLMASGSTSL